MNNDDPKAGSPANDDESLALKLLDDYLTNVALPETMDGVNFSYPEPLKQVSAEQLLAVKVKRSDGHYCLRLRFLDGDGMCISEAVYYPLSAMCGFVAQARRFWENKVTRTELSQRVESGATDLFHEMLCRLHPAMLEAMGNLTMGVYSLWAEGWAHEIERFTSLQGNPVRFDQKQINQLRRNFLEESQRYVKSLFTFKSLGRDVTDVQKQLFAKAYLELTGHWERVQKVWDKEGVYDWRHYAKSGPYSDTPDDLLLKLQRGALPSDLRLEHAARRAGIIKLDVDPKTQKLRQQGVPASGYKRTRLFELLKEGKELLESSASEDSVQEVPLSPKDQTRVSPPDFLP